MSETPRTDAEILEETDVYGVTRKMYPLSVHAEFAQQLEKELAQAKAELSTLRAECERLRGDAERYRWLCDEAYIWGDSKIYGEDVQIEPAALWILGSTDNPAVPAQGRCRCQWRPDAGF